MAGLFLLIRIKTAIYFMYQPIKRFKGENIGITTLPELQNDGERSGREASEMPSRSIIYVEQNESSVFWRFVLPMAHILAGDKNVVLCADPLWKGKLKENDFPIICLDASTLTKERLNYILQGSKNNPFVSIFENTNVPILIYMHGIHHAVSELHPLMTSLVDGRFGTAGQLDRSNSTHVVLSAVLDEISQENRSKVISQKIADRCEVFGVEI
jgi:hypothetical protein